MLVSVLVHLLVFLLWPDATIVLESVRGSQAVPAFEEPDPIRLVRLAAAPEDAVPEVSAPPVVGHRPEVTVREMAASRRAPDLTRANPLRGRPAVALPTHPGDAGVRVGEEERYVQPIARGILPNWRTPRSLHGVVVTARVHVDATCDPTGVVEFVPRTRNRQLNREIVYRVRGLEYQPARRNGEPVAAWAEITFVFCHTGVTAASPAPLRLPELPCDPKSLNGNGIESR